METGGKRKLSSNSIELGCDYPINMSPERKKSKLENNNSYSIQSDSLSDGHLSEMGVSLLPSDGEDGEESSEPHRSTQIASDKSDESSMDSLVHKSPEENYKPSESVMITPPDQILSFKSRRSIKSSSKIDLFSTLSDEIVLMIMQWLPRASLSECALVCQRWRCISYDESLWQRIDLTGQTVKSDQLGYVLQRNPIIMRMSQTAVASPIFSDMATSMKGHVSQLQYLDLSMAQITATDLACLLGKCQTLKKLSVEHCETNTDVCSSIAANTDLEVLNMSQCYQLEYSGLEEILVNCTELVELNLAWTRLDDKCLDSVSNLISNNIEKLNLSGGLKEMKNKHVNDLVTRCTCLTELDLSDCTEITAECLQPIMKHLCDITQLSFSRCYSLPLDSYMKLEKLPELQYLNIFGLMQPKQLETFKKNFHRLEINRHEFSTIARPTVGIRRTSIWGQRVRD